MGLAVSGHCGQCSRLALDEEAFGWRAGRLLWHRLREHARRTGHEVAVQVSRYYTYNGRREP